jgi:DNA polymerase-1
MTDAPSGKPQIPAARKGATLYLVDGHAHFYRAYHAITTAMTSPVTREPTNLTYGFLGMLLKLLREHRPDYLAVVIDASGDRETFRSELYPEYKANRPATPDDFQPQVERCLQVLALMGIPVIAVEGVEADDVIASIVRRLRRERNDLRIRIVSRDKDLAQVLCGEVELLDVYKDQTVGPEDFFRTPGVRPEHVRDILALMGDPIDNVPGIPGIGPKTAAELIMRYGSLEGLLAHLDEVKGRRRQSIESGRAQIEVARRLVALRDDLEVAFPVESARFEASRLPVQELLAVLRELGFRRHQDELLELTRAAPPPAAPAPPEGQGELFAPQVLAPVAAARYRIVRTLEELQTLVAAARGAGRCALDIRTEGGSALRARICGVALATAPGEAAYVPTLSPGPQEHLDEETVLGRLRPLLEDPALAKVGHDLKFSLNVLRGRGVRLAGLSFDTMVGSYLLDPSRSSHGIEVLSLTHLKHTCIPLRDLVGPGRGAASFAELPLDQAGPCASERADMSLRLAEAMSPRLEQIGLQELFRDVEMPLVEVLAELEHNGIRLDPVELDRQRERLTARLRELRRRIDAAAPHPFNPDSPLQLRAVLFNRTDQDPPGLGLRAGRRGKTGPSTDQEVLERLAADPAIESPVPRLIVEHRQLGKLLNTYLVALRDAIDPCTGRVHASFNQTVAATGRISSSDPNLQNIPIRTDVGREIRRAFVAEEGNVLISADYSQIELRLLAHLSGDEALRRAFHAGQDVHAAVAADIFGVAPPDVTPAQRDAAKMVNFGIVYGITPYGLSRRLAGALSVDEAARFIADYMERFPRIGEFLRRCVEQARAQGYVETILRRRRPIDQIASRNPRLRGLGERMAINTVVQGSAADLIKVAMVDLYRRLPEAHPGARMLLQIHDELVFEAPRDQAEPVRGLVVRRMESAMDLSVPLVVESAWSERWIDAK